MNNRFIITAAAATLFAMAAYASAPDGYYSSCEGKCGRELLKALNAKISSHTNVGYDGLWDVYEDSDVYPEDGKIRDIYSTKHWPTNSQRCGNYHSVGDCYNREHSVPQSWFDEKSPMKSDAYHVYPTDGKVNGQRSNYPYGECAGGTTLPASGSVKPLGRLGSCTSPGYSGKVFEPDDEYKGDLARTYFYMAACYNSQVSSWSGSAFAGNDYPVFTTWQTDVLMKWHAQDPVSDKETVRNDAINRHQRNRNPFIDYPDLADHIWGDRKAEPWYAADASQPQLTLPVNNSQIQMGYCAVNVPRTAVIRVDGKNMTSNTTVTVSGNGFTVSPATLSASQVNAGADVTVTFEATAAGEYNGLVSVKAGSLSSTVVIYAEAVDGLPVGEATDISDSSFTARWVNIDGASARYTLDVCRDGVSIAGYPLQVNAADERHDVTDLDASTTYTYTVASQSLTSRTVTVRTGAPLPRVDLLFDGELNFICDPGETSEVAELLLDAENIAEDFTITVNEPFELSTDKAEWTQSVVLLAEEERFYMRMRGDKPGTYTTTITLTAGEYVNDHFEAVGTVRSLEPSFIEDFEAEFTLGTSYYTGQYQGTAALWDIHNIGMYSGGHDSSNAIRFYNKSGESWIATADNKEHGIGTITFWAKGWKPSEGVDMAVEVSFDNGATWTEAAQIVAYGSEDYYQYTVTVNDPRPGRVRFIRNSNNNVRIRLDDVTISDYYASALIPDADYHDWDAYARDGKLIVETAADVDLLVYGADGIIRHDAPVSAGTTVLDTLAKGVYVVAVGDFTRVVVIK